MKTVNLNAFPRTANRRGPVKKLREAGRVPAVIYGRQQPKPQNLEVIAKDLEDLIHHSVSKNLLVDLTVKGDTRPKRLALVQEIQHHPLNGRLLHVDFHEVAEDERVIIQVPVETTGEAEGVKTEGGILEHVLFKVKVRALPKDLPEVIVVDVSHLKVGEAIHIGDIKPPPNVEVLGDKHISVAAPITEEQEAAAAAEAAAATAGEVEMIKEKKEEGEEGEVAPAKGEKGAAKPGEKAAPAPAKGEAKAAAPAKGAAAPAKGAEKAAEKPAERKR
jgi:large subunit ribosomal protein L25